jgi:hypothetical protein
MKGYYSKCYARYKKYKEMEINRVPEEDIYKAANYFIAGALRSRTYDNKPSPIWEVWYKGTSLKKAKTTLLTKGKYSFLCGWFDELRLYYYRREKGSITRIGCSDYSKLRFR